MFYLAKVIEYLIFPPGIFILLFFFTGLSIFKKSKSVGTLLIFISVVFYAVSTPWVANAMIRPLENRYPQPTQPRGDVIVVLGGGAVFGTPDVGGEGNLTGDAANRLLTGARLYHMLHVPIIFSGGPTIDVHGKPVSEASIAKRELISLGIPSSKIFAEGASRNTQENAVFSKRILMEHHLTHPILVTSAYHLDRAVLDFRAVGVDVLPFPADYQVNTQNEQYDFVWLPSANALSLTSVVLHEYFGFLATTLGVKA